MCLSSHCREVVITCFIRWEWNCRRAGKSKVMTLRNFVQLNSCTGFTRTCTDSFHCRCVGQNTKLKRASESCYFLWIWEITNSINYFLVVVMQRGIFTALVLIRCSRHLFWRTLFSHFMIERAEVTEMVLFFCQLRSFYLFHVSYGDFLHPRGFSLCET